MNGRPNENPMADMNWAIQITQRCFFHVREKSGWEPESATVGAADERGDSGPNCGPLRMNLRTMAASF